MKTKTKKTVWIPAIIAVTVAALLLIYYYYMSSVSGGKPGMRPPGGNVPGHMADVPAEKVVGVTGKYLIPWVRSPFFLERPLSVGSGLRRN
ncbi:hypothetical protein [Paenibacillus sp. ICGEB2008]|uniref:hypothetical protein n=1 Tax=Paenibacillus sp. ICGEB2008 TaxID=996640 RepID=UPI001E2E6DEE|nr:hypothetical protein [Paenibacillus sp. ICGEB2008]